MPQRPDDLIPANFIIAHLGSRGEATISDTRRAFKTHVLGPYNANKPRRRQARMASYNSWRRYFFALERDGAIRKVRTEPIVGLEHLTTMEGDRQPGYRVVYGLA